jgi:hypothetical protein
LQTVGVGLSFVPERVELRRNHQGRRQPGQVIGLQGSGIRVGGVGGIG